MPLPKFLELLDKDQVVYDSKDHPVELVRDMGAGTEYLSGWMKGPGDGQPVKFKTVVNLELTPYLYWTLKDKGIIATPTTYSNFLASALLSFLPIAFILLLLYFFFRQQIRMAGKGALNFGKSKARMLARDKNKVTFKDVAGVEEAREEVQEIVEFLRDPKRFQKLGGRIPKGAAICSWWARPEPARRFSREQTLPARRTCHSSRSPVRILWKCLSGSARAVSATCSSRGRKARLV